MTIKQKAEIIAYWLRLGHVIKCVGHLHAAIWQNGDYYHYSHAGTSAVKATPEKLEWLLTNIFDSDQEFYYINSADGRLYSTDDYLTLTADRQYKFSLYSRNIMTREEKYLKSYWLTIPEALRSYTELAEKFSGVHFAMQSENPFFSYWNFAV